MTLNEVIRVLELLAENVVNEQRAIDGIKARGVAFSATEANLQAIKDKNPPIAVLSTILSLAAPAPPTQPLRPRGKDLVIECAPVECALSLNGVSSGSTDNGRFVAEQRPFGRLVIHAAKDGYVSNEVIVDWNAESPSIVKIHLEATYDTRRAFGKSIAAEMLSKAGTSTCDLVGKGAASVWADSGSVAEYNVVTAFGPPALAEFELASEQGSVTLQCRGSELCRTKQSGRFRLGGPKKLPDDKVQQVVTHLRLFRRYHLCSLIESLVAPAMTALAANAASTDLQFVSSEGTYFVTLDQDHLPSAVSYTSKSGVGGGVQLTYADYVAVGVGKYPRRTAIRLPDSQKAGIQVRLQVITPGANLREGDFRW